MDFQKYTELVIKQCSRCGEMTERPYYAIYCEPCDVADAKERRPVIEAAIAQDERRRWTRQGIPARFFWYDLPDRHAEAAKRSTVIYGEIGTGKSCLGAQVMKKTGGHFISTIAMLDIIQDDNNRIWDFKETASLCLDDFTRPNPTKHRMEKLFEVIDARYAHDRHTVITTDTQPVEIKEKFGETGEAIVSRISEWCLRIFLEEKFR